MERSVRAKRASIFCLLAFGLLPVGSFCAAQAATGETAAVREESQLAIGDAATAKTPVTSPSVLPYFLRMILVLALVVAAIYGVFTLIRKAGRPARASDSFIRVLSSAQLAPGRSLHVVALGAKTYLLGSTDSSLALVSEIDDKELVDAMVLRAEASPEAPANTFASTLAGILGSVGGGGLGKRRAKKVPDDFFSRQRDRLKKF